MNTEKTPPVTAEAVPVDRRLEGREDLADYHIGTPGSPLLSIAEPGQTAAALNNGACAIIADGACINGIDAGDSYNLAATALDTGALKISGASIATYAQRLQPHEVDEIVAMAKGFSQHDSDEQAESELRAYLQGLNYRVA